MDVNKCRIDDSTEYWDFRLVGVSFRSSDGKSRQAALRRAAKKQDDFENPGFVFVDLARYEYEGAPAYHVYFDDCEVGNVPAALAAEIASMEDDGYVVSGERCEIYGGPTDYCEDRNYGARVYISLERRSPKSVPDSSVVPARSDIPSAPSAQPITDPAPQSPSEADRCTQIREHGRLVRRRIIFAAALICAIFYIIARLFPEIL